MSAYYNEIDPYCAQWLRNLIDADLILPGDVDERPIEEVSADDVKGYTQCHFFAGIGGWAYAARLAEWPDDAELWTGSCPCQPFSSAGKRLTYDDPRNLWPHFARLIADCKPSAVAGEQVASKAGRLWLAGVRADLEALGYGVGAADLCAAGVGAPHIRQRLWWVADTADSGHKQRVMGDETQAECAALSGRSEPKQGSGRHDTTYGGNSSSQLADADGRDASAEGLQRSGQHGQQPQDGYRDTPWADCIWLPCADGKARRIEPGIEPLAHGVPARVGKLRAYGNGIVPQEAAEVLIALREVDGG